MCVGSRRPLRSSFQVQNPVLGQLTEKEKYLGLADRQKGNLQKDKVIYKGGPNKIAIEISMETRKVRRI